MGAGEQREQEPVFIAEASQSHRLELLVIYKLTTPGPRAAPASPASAIIVWPRPGHLLRASRSAITSQSPGSALSPTPTLPARFPQRPPSQPALYAPTRTPPRLQKGQKDTRKRAQSRQGPCPKPLGEEAERATKNRTRSTKSPRLPPPLLCSSPRPCFSFPFPQDPGTPSPFQHPSAVITPPS